MANCCGTLKAVPPFGYISVKVGIHNFTHIQHVENRSYMKKYHSCYKSSSYHKTKFLVRLHPTCKLNNKSSDLIYSQITAVNPLQNPTLSTPFMLNKLQPMTVHSLLKYDNSFQLHDCIGTPNVSFLDLLIIICIMFLAMM